MKRDTHTYSYTHVNATYIYIDTYSSPHKSILKCLNTYCTCSAAHSQAQIYTQNFKCRVAECGVVMRGLAEASQRLWLNLVQSRSRNPLLNVWAVLSSDSALRTPHCNKSGSVPPFRFGATSPLVDRWKLESVCMYVHVCFWKFVLHIISHPHPIPKLSLMMPFSAPNLQSFSVPRFYHEWKIVGVGWMNNDLFSWFLNSSYITRRPESNIISIVREFKCFLFPNTLY